MNFQAFSNLKRSATLSVFLLMLGGCSHPTLKERACSGMLARFETRMEALAMGLSPWNPAVAVTPVTGTKTRAPASVRADRSDELLRYWRDRDSWTSLSREILNEVQGYLDLTIEDSRMGPLRRKISRLADHVVALHGYAVEGRSERMQQELADARVANANLRAELCEK